MPHKPQSGNEQGSSAKLIEQAGESWRTIVANHLTSPTREVHSEIEQLNDLAERINDPSLHFAVRQATHLVSEGISGINVMGTMGSGKSAVGIALAQALGTWSYVDADTFHPAENIEKMRRGEPLAENDRLSFLKAAADFFRSGHARVSSCSALKDSYRAVIHGNPSLSHEGTRWSFPEATLGLVTVCLVKPFEAALSELDYAEKHAHARRTLNDSEHFIHVTKENSSILEKQYEIFEQPKPWQAITLHTEHYRDTSTARGSYDTDKMIDDLLGALGMRVPGS
jgi:gluconate kinase